MINIVMPFKPLTYNQYYRNTRSGNRVKTGAGHAYDEKLEVFFEDYEKELKDFAAGVDDKYGIIELNLRIYDSTYFIKSGAKLHEKTGDIDGGVKVLQDKIFSLMGIDDFRVKSLRIDSVPSNIDQTNLILYHLDTVYPNDLSHL